jgi:hypothetical protein
MSCCITHTVQRDMAFLFVAWSADKVRRFMGKCIKKKILSPAYYNREQDH